MEEIPVGLYPSAQQESLEEKNEDPRSPDGDGGLSSVFSSGFSAVPRADMYRAWVYPEMYPGERQPVLQNWHADDLWVYCGIRKETSGVH